MPNAIHERVQHANAKLTLHLHVTGVRSDGYHLLDAEMVSLDLFDQLTFDEGDSLTVGGFGAGFIPTSSDNLVMKALRLSGKTAKVHLQKAVPTGGGLGGGSSDAAAALRWAGVLEPRVAVQIGADVPFCIRGGRAHVRGIGEDLMDLPFVARTYTLVIPPFSVNTAAVFRQYDKMAFFEVRRISERNHLLAPAFVVEPRLQQWYEKIREWTGQEPALAGSGATLFVEGAMPQPPDDQLEGGRWVVANTTPPLQL